MSFSNPNGDNFIHYIPPSTSQISSHSTLGNRSRNPAPAAPAHVTQNVPSPFHNNPPFPPVASHPGGALVHGPHNAVPAGYPPSGGYSNFGGVPPHAAPHGPYVGALPYGSAPAWHGPTSSVPSQHPPATATTQAEWRGISNVTGGSRRAAYHTCIYCYLSSRECDGMKPSCGTCRADGLDGKCDYRATVDGRAITEEVKQALEQFYQTRNKAPTYEERLDLAKETGCRTEDIKTWFNNRRRADRSDVKTSSTPTDSKKKWKKMSKSQNNFLEDYVRRNDRPDGPQRDWIAGQLNLDTEYIHKWFDHTRQKYHRANNPS